MIAILCLHLTVFIKPGLVPEEQTDRTQIQCLGCALSHLLAQLTFFNDLFKRTINVLLEGMRIWPLVSTRLSKVLLLRLGGKAAPLQTWVGMKGSE